LLDPITGVSAGSIVVRDGEACSISGTKYIVKTVDSAVLKKLKESVLDYGYFNDTAFPDYVAFLNRRAKELNQDGVPLQFVTKSSLEGMGTSFDMDANKVSFYDFLEALCFKANYTYQIVGNNVHLSEKKSAYVEEDPAPISASDALRATALGAETFKIYEGLPRFWTDEDLKKELKRKDTTRIASHSFYTPSVTFHDPEPLRKYIASPSSMRVFGGEKECGGFHPNYAVHWEKEGKPYYALICFGCHEIIYLSRDNSYRYELSQEAYAVFVRILEPFALKGPKTGL
jgi:hypothetical protein